MKNMEIAVFGGGCFWCTEALFKSLKGVYSVTPGYAGGITPNPTYSQVSLGTTGHAEVIKIEFDPAVIPYADLLEVFMNTHDPTTPLRQGSDIGPQYRSIILYLTQAQKNTAGKLLEKLKNSGVYSETIVTGIKPLEVFYPAESYHKNYYEKNEFEPYCQLIISPKLQHLKEKYANKLKN